MTIFSEIMSRNDKPSKKPDAVYEYLPPPKEMRSDLRLLAEETTSEKIKRKVISQPLVPIGKYKLALCCESHILVLCGPWYFHALQVPIFKSNPIYLPSTFRVLYGVPIALWSGHMYLFACS